MEERKVQYFINKDADHVMRVMPSGQVSYLTGLVDFCNDLYEMEKLGYTIYIDDKKFEPIVIKEDSFLYAIARFFKRLITWWKQ